LVSAANGSARFAGALFGLLSQPKPLLSVTTEEEAKTFVTDLSGEAAETVLSRSAESIEVATTLQATGGTYFRRSGYGQKVTVS
jgi:hypothetical protein